MADEKRQLILDLLARNKMTPGTEGAGRDLDKLGKSTDKLGKQTEELGGITVIAGKEAEKLGHSAEDTKRRIADLDEEIRKSTRELGEMAIAFHEAQSQAEKLDISKAMRRTEADIRRVTKSKGLLGNLLPDPAPAAKSWSKRLNDSIVGELASKSFLGTGAAVLGVALAPELGALIAGAVVGGVGTGGIVGGMALAFKGNQQAADYGSRIGKMFVSGITKEARGAFDVPLMESLNKVEALATRTVGKLGKIFTNLAPSTGKFVDSLVRSGDVITNSLVNASGKAAPVMAALGRIVEGTSISLGKFIDMAADHADEGASALDDLADSLTSAMDAATNFVGAMATVKGGLDNVDSEIDSARYSLEDQVSWLDLTADGYKKGSAAAELYRKGLIGAKGSANDYDHLLAGAVQKTDQLATSQDNAARAARGQRDALSGLSKELKAESDPAFALLSAQDNLTTKQDALTEAIKTYGSKSKEAGAASRDLASAAIDLQGAAGSLSGKFSGELTPAMLATLQAAGLTAGQIAAVKRQFELAKGAGDAYSKTYRAKIITDYINRYSNVVTSAADQAYQDTKKSIKKRASGGPVARGEPYIVGENGPEVWMPTAAGKVLSAAASRGLVRVGGPARGSGSGSQVVRLELVGPEQIRTMFRYMIRSMNLLQEEPV